MCRLLLLGHSFPGVLDRYPRLQHHPSVETVFVDMLFSLKTVVL
jgi:hypothetical protein